MQPAEYQTLFELEMSYWWYRGLRSTLLSTMKGLGLGPSSRILDAGCGTGGNLLEIQDTLAPDSYGFDVSVDAARFWPQRGCRHTCLASMNAVPFRAESFDGVICVDVLECEGVHEDQAYTDLCRVVRPGGFLLFVVPAYDWLYNATHHQAVGACRRYTKTGLAAFLGRAPVELVRVTYLFAGMLPLIAMHRLLQRVFRRGSNVYPRSDLRVLPRPVNAVLSWFVALERLLVLKTGAPFGSSLLAIVRKQPSRSRA